MLEIITKQYAVQLVKAGVISEENETTVVQRIVPTKSTGEPVPFSVGDFERIMLTGAVVVAADMHQLVWLKGLQIGQQIHLPCPFNGFGWNEWHFTAYLSDRWAAANSARSTSPERASTAFQISSCCLLCSQLAYLL